MDGDIVPRRAKSTVPHVMDLVVRRAGSAFNFRSGISGFFGWRFASQIWQLINELSGSGTSPTHDCGFSLKNP
jgi:hypothetical protein